MKPLDLVKQALFIAACLAAVKFALGHIPFAPAQKLVAYL